MTEPRKRVCKWDDDDLNAMIDFAARKKVNKTLRWNDLKLSVPRSEGAIRRKFSNLKKSKQSLQNDVVQILVEFNHNNNHP